MVKTKNKKSSVVYMLVILALTLLVATTTIERAFSAMSIMKNWLQNQMDN